MAPIRIEIHGIQDKTELAVTVYFTKAFFAGVNMTIELEDVLTVFSGFYRKAVEL
jgi:hypothetical protein